jgi:hypothetical protein
MSEHLKAPFRAEAVVHLNRYQNYSGWHPFTCGNDRGSAEHKAYAEAHGGDWGQLIATSTGWVCPVCGYTQDWAHDFMGSGDDMPELPNIFAAAPKGHPKPRLERPFEPCKGLKPEMLQFTIYEKPADYPENWVVRQWELYASSKGTLIVPGPHRIAWNLEGARELIPLGQYRLGRNTEDDPYIVETWI